MTLENYDGRKWSRTKTAKNLPSTEGIFVPLTSGKPISYDVIVEPSYQSWLFGLTVATSNNTKLRLIDDYTIQSRSILSQITHYQVDSYLKAPLDLTITDDNKQRNLVITQGSNPRLEKLAVKLKQEFPNLVNRSNAVLAIFREQQYFYTLEAPLLINNSLDQFFFDTKAGFCVHYASAYTYLMRAAGIPARVVTGYLGGEYNNISGAQNSQQTKQGGYLSIYQYDAHAWAEIWLEGIGWQRVDPTAAVDPQRVESGWSNALLAQQSSLNNDLVGLYQFKNIAWLNTLRLQLDALDYQWTRWVLGYSSKQQYDLLKRWFGKKMPWKTAAIIVSTLVLIMVLFTLFQRLRFNWSKRNKYSPWLKLYQQIVNKLANKGLVKPANITPTDFAYTVAQHYPQISNEFIEFTNFFEYLMYQELSTAKKKEYFIRLQKLSVLINKSLH
jgi:transglutaminase-like putative cysteine protease